MVDEKKLVELLACIPSMHKTRMGIEQHIETRLSTKVITYIMYIYSRVCIQ